MNVRASINGGPPTSFQVDTGSVGVILSEDEIPGFDPSKGTPGSITYSSSGVQLIGIWTTTTLSFPDSVDAQGHKGLATVTLPVLAVSQRKIIPGAVNGSSRAAASTEPTTKPHPHMFGVGFGRGKDPHPDRNPFINLTEMNAGTMRRGYSLTRDGIHLGLTAPLTANYTFAPLKPRDYLPDESHKGLKDFDTAVGSVTVNGRTLPAPILMDTGLTNMMISQPDLAERTDPPEGTPITITLPGGKYTYTIKVGDTSNPMSPRRVTLTTQTPKDPTSPNNIPSTTLPATPQPPRATVNTGLKALHAFDYLYDAEAGLLGLRQTVPIPTP